MKHNILLVIASVLSILFMTVSPDGRHSSAGWSQESF